MARKATAVKFRLSRLVVDVERFPDNCDEPMSRVGMGAIYTCTAAAGSSFLTSLAAGGEAVSMSLYEAHSSPLARRVADELAGTGRALIVDCHSSSSHPRPAGPGPINSRAAFRLGTDRLHSAETLTRSVALPETMATAATNRQHAGSLAPCGFWGKDLRVALLVIATIAASGWEQATVRKERGRYLLRERMEGFGSSVTECGRGLRRATAPSTPSLRLQKSAGPVLWQQNTTDCGRSAERSLHTLRLLRLQSVSRCRHPQFALREIPFVRRK